MILYRKRILLNTCINVFNSSSWSMLRHKTGFSEYVVHLSKLLAQHYPCGCKRYKKNLYHGRRQYANESSICMPSSYLREFDMKRKDTRSLMKLSI